MKFNSKHLATLVAIFLFQSAAHVNADHRTKSEKVFFDTTVPEQEIITQFHGDPVDADLRLFMAGNQFVVMDLLISEFKRQYPEVRKIFYVTLPPGQLLQWILKGGIQIHGENSFASEGFRLTVMPDVYTTVNAGHMDQLAKAGLITRYYTYMHNRLVLMCSDAHPLAGQALSAREFYDIMSDTNVTISEPDILTQGIERHFWQMYTDTSKTIFPADSAIQSLDPAMYNPANLVNDPDNSLRKIVYLDKVNSGKTTLTSIHHLETPAAIRNGSAEIGGVWVTEVLYQKNRLGATDISMIETDDKGSDGKYLDRREKVNYLSTIVEGVMDEDNRRAAIAWNSFLRSPEAQAIIHHAGFIPASDQELTIPFIYPESWQNSKIGNY